MTASFDRRPSFLCRVVLVWMNMRGIYFLTANGEKMFGGGRREVYIYGSFGWSKLFNGVMYCLSSIGTVQCPLDLPGEFCTPFASELIGRLIPGYCDA